MTNLNNLWHKAWNIWNKNMGNPLFLLDDSFPGDDITIAEGPVNMPTSPIKERV